MVHDKSNAELEKEGLDKANRPIGEKNPGFSPDGAYAEHAADTYRDPDDEFADTDEHEQLTPQQAADRIRDKVSKKAPTPQDRHAEKYINEVVTHLGMEITPANFAQVARAMHEEGIDPVFFDEYPKHITVKDRDGNDVVLAVHNRDEEARANDGTLDDDELRRVQPGRPVSASVFDPTDVQRWGGRDRIDDRDRRGDGPDAKAPGTHMVTQERNPDDRTGGASIITPDVNDTPGSEMLGENYQHDDRPQIYGGTVARDPAPPHGPLDDAQRDVAAPRSPTPVDSRPQVGARTPADQPHSATPPKPAVPRRRS